MVPNCIRAFSFSWQTDTQTRSILQRNNNSGAARRTAANVAGQKSKKMNKSITIKTEKNKTVQKELFRNYAGPMSIDTIRCNFFLPVVSSWRILFEPFCFFSILTVIVLCILFIFLVPSTFCSPVIWHTRTQQKRKSNTALQRAPNKDAPFSELGKRRWVTPWANEKHEHNK